MEHLINQTIQFGSLARVFKAALISTSFNLGRKLVAFVPESKHSPAMKSDFSGSPPHQRATDIFPPETFPFDPNEWTLVNRIKKSSEWPLVMPVVRAMDV